MKNINSEKTIILSKYLITKGVYSTTKIQKLLFFLRYEEIRKNIKSEYFYNEGNNFQAWIYGPVNLFTYNYLKNFSTKINELKDDASKNEFNLIKNKFSLNKKSDEFIKLDKIYGKYFVKWNSFTTSKLISKSHKNKSWINARGNKNEFEHCEEFLSENKNDILEFKK